MKSHDYTVGARDLARILGLPALFVAVFAVGMHAGARFGWLPDPRPALDTDRTILLHQAEASARQGDARIILLGDSSCLMGLSSAQLGGLLPGNPPVINLGTLSYLDLDAFGMLLRRFTAVNPDQRRTLVLLMHPEALRRASPSEYHVSVLRHYIEGRDFCPPNVSPVICALGVEIFRDRILSRVVPQPLGGAYGRHYGFTRDLWTHLASNRGSAVDPGRFNAETARGHVELRLAASLQAASVRFRESMPAGARLVVGITPLPQGMGGANQPGRVREMLATWSGWLGADVVLTNLPVSMPDEFFASATHLNERGIQEYTRLLANALMETGAVKE